MTVNKATIVQQVKDSFDVEDIDRVWEYLGSKFGVNLNGWREEFHGYFNPLREIKLLCKPSYGIRKEEN